LLTSFLLGIVGSCVCWCFFCLFVSCWSVCFVYLLVSWCGCLLDYL